MDLNRKLRVPVIVMVVSVLLAAALLSAGITAAYLMDVDKVDNPFLVGETVNDVVETFSPPSTLPPAGEAVTKEVRILNSGNLTCLIRARLLFEDDVLTMLTEPFETCEGWAEGDDGFYYYLFPVAPGESTEPLIREIRFRADAGEPAEHVQAVGLSESGLIVYSEALEYVSPGGAFSGEPGGTCRPHDPAGHFGDPADALAAIRSAWIDY